VVGDQNAEQAVSAISKSARTGGNGEGKVFITDIKEAVCLRAGGKRGSRSLKPTPKTTATTIIINTQKKTLVNGAFYPFSPGGFPSWYHRC